MPGTKVSVLIPVYNMADTIDETMRSLLAQTHADFEALVIDDGSADDSARRAARFAPGGAEADPRVRVIRQANGGKLAALNTALDAATGDAVTILDADDTWPPDSLELRVRALEAHPEVVAVYSDANYMDQDGRVYRRRDSRPFGTMGQLLASLICPVIGATLMTRRRVLDQFRPLDTSFIRSDDAYVNAEVFLRGPMLYVPGVVLNYRNYPRPGNLRLRVMSAHHDLRLIKRYLRPAYRQAYYMTKVVLVAAVKLLYEAVTSKK